MTDDAKKTNETTVAPVRPDHYRKHPSGVEAWDIVEWLPFNVGNAIKYLFRADHKGSAIEDLRKAVTYLRREKERMRKSTARQTRHLYTLPEGIVQKVIDADNGVLGLTLRALFEWNPKPDLTKAIVIVEKEIERRVEGCGACAQGWEGP